MHNEDNLKPNTARTPEERKELARKAGRASGRSRRERKSIAEALKAVLSEKTPDKKMTKQQAIITKVVTRLYADPNIRDLKTLAEILGEIKQEQTLTIKEGKPTIIFTDSEDDE